jgi:hypothetical protein
VPPHPASQSTRQPPAIATGKANPLPPHMNLKSTPPRRETHGSHLRFVVRPCASDVGRVPNARLCAFGDNNSLLVLAPTVLVFVREIAEHDSSP